MNCLGLFILLSRGLEGSYKKICVCVSVHEYMYGETLCIHGYIEFVGLPVSSRLN